MKKALALLALLALPFLAAQTFPPPSGPGAAAVTYGSVVPLVESTNTQFMTVEIPQGSFFGGWILANIECSDASDILVATLYFITSCYNDAGALDCFIDDGTDYAFWGSAGSFTAGDVNFTTGTNEVSFHALVACTLTQTTLDWHWRLQQTPSSQKTVRIP